MRKLAEHSRPVKPPPIYSNQDVRSLRRKIECAESMLTGYLDQLNVSYKTGIQHQRQVQTAREGNDLSVQAIKMEAIAEKQAAEIAQLKQMLEVKSHEIDSVMKRLDTTKKHYEEEVALRKRFEHETHRAIKELEQLRREFNRAKVAKPEDPISPWTEGNALPIKQDQERPPLARSKLKPKPIRPKIEKKSIGVNTDDTEPVQVQQPDVKTPLTWDIFAKTADNGEKQSMLRKLQTVRRENKHLKTALKRNTIITKALTLLGHDQ